MAQLKNQLLHRYPPLQSYIENANTNEEIYRGVQDLLATLSYAQRQNMLADIQILVPVELYNTWSYRSSSSVCLNVYDAYRNYKEGQLAFQVTKSLEIEEYLAYQDIDVFIAQYTRQMPLSIYQQLVNVVPLEILKNNLTVNDVFKDKIQYLHDGLTPERLSEMNITKIVADHFADLHNRRKYGYSSDVQIITDTINSLEYVSIPAIAQHLDPREWTFEGIAQKYMMDSRSICDDLVEQMARHFEPNYLQHYFFEDHETKSADFFGNEQWFMQPAIALDKCTHEQKQMLFNTILNRISQNRMFHPSYWVRVVQLIDNVKTRDRERGLQLADAVAQRTRWNKHVSYTGWKYLQVFTSQPENNKNNIPFILDADATDPTLHHFMSELQVEILKHVFGKESSLTDEQKSLVTSSIDTLLPNQPFGLDYIHAVQQLEPKIVVAVEPISTVQKNLFTSF